MSRRAKRPGGALAARPSYEVGYGKPPEASRFQKGVSGNPRGRPKGAKTRRPALHEERMKGIILDEAYRGITVREGDRNVSIPMAQAIVRALAVNAVKGQHRSQRLFAELLAAVESSNKILHDQWLETTIGYKADWEKELARRERLGITDLPEPLPHPDQIRIDFDAGTAIVVGPVTKEEKVFYDMLLDRRNKFEAELQYLADERKATTDPERIEAIDAETATVRRLLDIIGQRLEQ